MGFFSDSTKIFGFLKGPSNCNGIGCSFSSTAFTELKRRGFSDKLLDSVSKVKNYENIRSVANAIKGINPRKITLPLNPTKLGLAQASKLAEDLVQLNINRRLSEFYGVGSNSFVSQLTKQIDDLTDQINKLRNPTTTVNGIDIVVDADNSIIADNPLNDYHDVQYHVGLTMLSEDEALRFQREGFAVNGIQYDVNTLKAYNRTDNSVTLANTGDSFTNTNSDMDYYNITSLVIKNIMEPTEMNPLISTMLSMRMRIVEPHGFHLHEDLRKIACGLGYSDINPGRILYRVDIYFSGYNQDTGEWIEQIPLNDSTSMISAIMSISNIEAEVGSAGTQYELDLVPAGHHAYRPEDFITDASAIQSGSDFRGFLQNLAISLSDAKQKRTQGEIIRHYEFYAPSVLLDSPFDIDAFVNQNKFLFGDGDPNHIIASGQSVDLLTILQGSIANTLVGQELFNADIGNDNFLTPRVHFAVRFNTVYGQKDPGLNDYKEITHQYIIEPYLTYKQGPVKKETMSTYVDPQNQLLRVKEIIRLGMLRRIYNYLNTSENTEVIDFGIQLKSFYFMALNITSKTDSAGGVNFNGTASGASSLASKQNDLFRVLNTHANVLETEKTIKRLFGDYRYDLSEAGIGEACLTGANRLGGGFNETADTQLFGDVTSPSDKRRNDYQVYMDDYLSLDLLKLNDMKVRGDPVWLLSPYANVDITKLDKVTDTGEVGSNSTPTTAIQVQPRGGQVIYLKMHNPTQEDYMNPNRAMGSSSPNVIGGFYQIIEVVSTFEDGKFTQTIEGTKLNHLNYVEELFQRDAGFPTSTSDMREPTVG